MFDVVISKFDCFSFHKLKSLVFKSSQHISQPFHHESGSNYGAAQCLWSLLESGPAVTVGTRCKRKKIFDTIEHLELPMWSKISSPRKMLDEVRCRQLFVNFLSKYVSISSLNFQISDSFLRFQMVKILKVRDEAEFILKVVSSSKFPWNKLKELHLTLIFDGTDEVIERSGILVSVKIFFLAGFVCRDANFMLG